METYPVLQESEIKVSEGRYPAFAKIESAAIGAIHENPVTDRGYEKRHVIADIRCTLTPSLAACGALRALPAVARLGLSQIPLTSSWPRSRLTG